MCIEETLSSPTNLSISQTMLIAKSFDDPPLTNSKKKPFFKLQKQKVGFEKTFLQTANQ
jgi:hypothetical protein